MTFIKKAVKRAGGVFLSGCLLAALSAGFSALAEDEPEATVIGGVANQETGMIDYIIDEDAGDTVVLDGTVMEQFILNKAWQENPKGWVPGDTSVGRMQIFNQSGSAYLITGVKVSVFSPADLENVTYPEGYDIKGPDGSLIPTEFVQHRIPSKPLAALYGLDSTLDLTLEQLVNAEAKIAEDFAGTDVKTYADYLFWYIQNNAETVAKEFSKTASVQEKLIADIAAATRFSELPDNAIFWLQRSGNAAVNATDEEVAAVIAGNPKAEIYGHRDEKPSSRYYIYEFDEEVAQANFNIQFRKLVFFSFDNEQYPVILENDARKDNPDMAMIDHIRQEGVAAESVEAVLGGKEIAAGDDLALENVAYHVSTSMNNNYQVTGLSFMFTITLEKVKVPYQVTYDANGGTGSRVDEQNPYFAGSTVDVLDDTGISREGYDFTGWNTAADGSGTAYQAGDSFTMPEADVTLYAQWTPIEEIPDEETPLVPNPPQDPDEEIPDETVPLSPSTGVGGQAGLLLLAAGAAALAITARKKIRK